MTPKKEQEIRKMVETRRKNGSYKLTEAQKQERRRVALQLGYGKWMKDKIVPLSVREKISKSLQGEKNYQWISDRSLKQYGDEFTTELKEKIRERDGRICQICGKTEEEEKKEYGRRLCVNHIDFDKHNCSESNLNTLCMICNKMINHNREYWTNYFKNIANKT